MGQHNIIELNGKRYDAVTGAVLGDAHSRGHIPIAPRPRMVDGFTRASKIPQPVAVKPTIPKYVPAPNTSSRAAPKKMDVSRTSSATKATEVKHHQPQKGKTLMRRAVHKPQVTIKPAIRVQAPSEIAPASVKTIAKPLAKKLSVANVDPSRAQRAGIAAKSNAIRHFQPHSGHDSHATRPQHTTAQHQVSPAHVTPHVPSGVSRPIAFTPLHKPPVAAHAVARPTTAPAKRPQTDIFEAAIAHATSHEQRAPRIRRSPNKRFASVLAGVGAFLIMGGFLAYLNMPGIEMQFASMKVGFRAELPEYAPAGYAMKDGVKTTPEGGISVSFRSGDSSYSVSQQPSDWNSQTLLETYVAANASNHQTVQSQGRTIYIYNGNNATWVDGGIRYEISGNAPLSADDIVKLAASI